MGFLELPDQPDEPQRREHARADGGDRSTPKRRELPDPDERGRAYEAMRAHVSAETRDEPGGSYWDAVPRFLDLPGRLRSWRPEPTRAPPVVTLRHGIIAACAADIQSSALVP